MRLATPLCRRRTVDEKPAILVELNEVAAILGQAQLRQHWPFDQRNEWAYRLGCFDIEKPNAIDAVGDMRGDRNERVCLRDTP